MMNVSGVQIVFDHKGIIEGCTEEGKEEVTHEKVEEIAIEAGAEDVNVNKDVEGKQIFKVNILN